MKVNKIYKGNGYYVIRLKDNKFTMIYYSVGVCV